MFDLLLNLIAEGVAWFFILIILLVDIGACITLLFLERRNPQVVAGWLLLILFLPIVGFVVYLFFGRHLYGEHIFSKIIKIGLCDSDLIWKWHCIRYIGTPFTQESIQYDYIPNFELPLTKTYESGGRVVEQHNFPFKI